MSLNSFVSDDMWELLDKEQNWIFSLVLRSPRALYFPEKVYVVPLFYYCPKNIFSNHSFKEKSAYLPLAYPFAKIFLFPIPLFRRNLSIVICPALLQQIFFKLFVCEQIWISLSHRVFLLKSLVLQQTSIVSLVPPSWKDFC